MWRILVACSALTISCSGEHGPGKVLNDSREADNGQDRWVDGVQGECRPGCAARNCGSNGCGGSCGSCVPFQEQCSDAGQCEPFQCVSSVYCPGSLVCDATKGICVVCVVDADCAEDDFCGPDAECHGTYSCDSDKDCKELGLVCDFVLESCVECLASEQCSADEYCSEGFCLEAECTPGESKCEDKAVMICPDGSGWQMAQTCGENEYCKEDKCEAFVCNPGETWCEGEVYKVCNAEGTQVQHEEDCSLSEKHCFQGVCLDTLCEPQKAFCIDGETAATCSDDGLSVDSKPCEAEHSCVEATCTPWECTPDLPMCDGGIATQCDELGQGPVPGGEDCGFQDKTCSDGECQGCLPACEGLDCGDDGCGGVCGECGVGQVCINGKCPPEGLECDDGNSTDWDGCTDGQLTEFRVNAFSANDQGLPTVAAVPGGHLLAAWQTKGQFGEKTLPAARPIEPNVGPVGSDKNLSDSPDWHGADPVAAFAGNGRLIVAWQNTDGQDGDSHGVFARPVYADGGVAGDVVQVNSNWPGVQGDQEIACIPDIGCLIVWMSNVGTPGAPQHTIAGQWFKAEGSMSGGEFSLVQTVGAQNPAVSCADSEHCVVAWTQDNGDSSEKAVWVAHIGLNGTAALGADQANTVDLGNQLQPAVACDGTGNFLVVWQSDLQDPGGGFGIFGRMMSSELAWTGEQFQISAPLDGDQMDPQVAGSPFGGFLVVWNGAVAGDSKGIGARHVDADGTLAADDLRMNVFVTNHQVYPAVAGMDTGEFVVIWQSNMGAETGTEIDVMARRLAPESIPLYL